MKAHTPFRNLLATGTALSVFALAGCTNESGSDTLPSGEDAGKQITLTATTGHARTRLTYEDQNPAGTDVGISIYWKAGDQFMLYKGGDGQGEVFTTDEDGIRGSANFTGTLPVSETEDGYLDTTPHPNSDMSQPSSSLSCACPIAPIPAHSPSVPRTKAAFA